MHISCKHPEEPDVTKFQVLSSSGLERSKKSSTMEESDALPGKSRRLSNSIESEELRERSIEVLEEDESTDEPVTEKRGPKKRTNIKVSWVLSLFIRAEKAKRSYQAEEDSNSKSYVTHSLQLTNQRDIQPDKSRTAKFKRINARSK
jgi:hypothetical protein